MALSVPLPKSIQSELGGNTHPGLELDKYVASWEEGGQAGKLSEKVQRPAIDNVVKLSRSEPEGCHFRDLCARRSTVLGLLGAESFRCQTTGPLTLHRARASALENAGICLHPIYGFTYFPGSGLKGMARAFAETVWLPGQFKAAANGQPDGPEEEEKARQAWERIERVFGWAPGSDTVDKGEPKPWKPKCVPKHSEKDSAHSGNIVFHDAWPEKWPPLFMDILNNHHPEYYRGKDDEDAPGDWENPIPVYFLAVPPGQTFSFALSKRRNDVDNSKGGRDARAPELIDLAKEWLLGALCHLGAGAKTAAGYGCFKPIDRAVPTPPSPARQTFQTTLELVTPAFLAGAKQEREDCDLRPATLRGLLRSWWRTMHAGWVDVATLRKLEAAVWGDTNSGGAVRLTLEPGSPLDPQQYNYKDRFRPKAEFKQQHELENSPNSKTTQGLFYLSYGMDEISHGEARHRWYKDAGTRWRIGLSARGTAYEERNARGQATRKVGVEAPQVLRQAHAALWLLCQFGGVGSKARKGFGSLGDIEGMTLDDCQKAGREFREACGVPQRQRDGDSPALEKMLPILAIPTPWRDAWFALDQLGFGAQAFAQKFAHNPDKLALGLPRKIHGPRSAPMTSQDGKNWKPEKWLGDLHQKLGSRKGKEKDMRDASPVHYHLAKAPDETLTIRVTAFPARYLPDAETSRKFLSKLLGHLKTDLEKRAKDLAAKGQQKAPPRAAAAARVSRPAPAERPLSKAGDLVEALLVEDPKGKGRRFAKHAGSGRVGSIQNPGDIPPDKKTGDQVRLIVAIWTTDQIQFKWPKPLDSEKPGKAKPRSGPGAGRFRR
jgi:CRISPR-associated protein Cmr6